FALMADAVLKEKSAPDTVNRHNLASFSSRHPQESLEHQILLCFGATWGGYYYEQLPLVVEAMRKALDSVSASIEKAAKTLNADLTSAILGNKGMPSVPWGPVLAELAPIWAKDKAGWIAELEAVVERIRKRWRPFDKCQPIMSRKRHRGMIRSLRHVFAYKLHKLLSGHFSDDPPEMAERKIVSAIARLWVASGWYQMKSRDRVLDEEEWKDVKTAVRDSIAHYRRLWDTGEKTE
ncbi:MAG: hypothetical protein ISR64_09755, partial [Deltaproteobacteria bacterium]|nr:hypothetical protein [Deltaproteobacteria bacterium]